ncbi:MAG: ATP-dependent RecD-like DNA helicase [Erysipelotrichaceae bacterium]
MEENNIETLTGKFTYCIYKSFNYGVFRFNDNDDGNIVVRGSIDNIDMNSEYILHGKYVDHPKYGFQFEVYNIELKPPSSYEGIIAYLSSDLFKGIGKKKAKKIVDHFGTDTISIIKNQPELLFDVGLKDKDVNTIKEVLSSNLEYEESFYYLVSLGLSIKDINKIINLYKENTIDNVKSNPYQLYFDIYGIGYKKCDDLASKIGYDPLSDNRIIAFISYLISELSFRTGNTYFSYAELKDAYYYNLKNDIVDFDYALNLAINEKKIFEDNDRYYASIQRIAEEEISKFMIENNISDEYSKDEINNEISALENNQSISYDRNQIEAIHKFYSNKISFVIGGPGTGKTTIVKALVETVKKLHPTYELHVVAPTGRAAKRISELCDVSSSTIHSLLRWDKETNTFTYSIDNPLLLDVLIIDEFSMVDNWLFYKLVSALYNVRKICIIGDDNQLPSVGPGNLLKDMLDSNLFPYTRLNTIFRQGSQSSIIRLCNDILKDSIDFKNYGDDILFIEGDEAVLKDRLVYYMHQFLDDGFDINDLQVLSPMYKGGLGIDSLNSMLQEVFNPKDELKNEIRTKFRIYRENDKILQLKNQNSDDVYNGDIGFISAINPDKFDITAVFDDIIVDYTKDDIDKIALAYTVSVHKAQGSEYNVVFLAISKAHTIMLNKNLIYTAVSRASNKLIILGDKETFIKGARKNMRIRKTSLKDSLLNYYQNNQ